MIHIVVLYYFYRNMAASCAYCTVYSFHGTVYSVHDKEMRRLSY